MFNQAMMELGATLCVPREPKCLLCPVSAHCEAWRWATEREFPSAVDPRKITNRQDTPAHSPRRRHFALAAPCVQRPDGGLLGNA